MHVGISYRSEIPKKIRSLVKSGLVTMLEIIPEAYAFARTRELLLEQLLHDFNLPYCFHFVGFSPASPQNKREFGFRKRVRMAKIFQPLWISEHATLQKGGDYNFEMNLPFPRTEETLELLVENLKLIKKETGRELLLENIPASWEFKESTLSAADFFSKAVKRADCGILLDVHNLHTDLLNFGFDAKAFIRSLPMDRVREIHVAGGEKYRDVFLDGHCNRLSPGDFELLRFALVRCQPQLVLLERENNFRNLSDLESDLKAIWKLCEKRKKTNSKPNTAA